MTYVDLDKLELEFEEYLSTCKEEDEVEEEFKPKEVRSRAEVIPGLLYRLLPDTSWMKNAACRGLGPDLFFPERGDNDTSQAKSVCRDCPVKEECLNFALDYNIKDGTWGGESARGRRVRKARHVEIAA